MESESEAESDDTVEVAEARLGDLLKSTETDEASAGEEITGSSESTADEEDIKLHNQNCL